MPKPLIDEQADMDQTKKSLFASVHSLQKVLGGKNILQIIHPGYIWNASFTWSDPVMDNIADGSNELLRDDRPGDLLEFWTQISDGALLYYDQKYGQWGYKIYSSLEISDKQIRWKNLFGDLWKSNFLAIGEIIDEVHPIVAIPDEISKDNLSYSLYEGNALDPIDDWLKMASSFHEWIDRLITAQGAKFWSWK